MQFDNVKLMLRWFFREFKTKETPRGLRSSACIVDEVQGKLPSRLQNVAEVIITHNKCISVLQHLNLQEINMLSNYYKSKRTLARIERDYMRGKSTYNIKVDIIEAKIEPYAHELNLISENMYEQPKYIPYKETLTWIKGAKEISKYIGRSVSWFYQFGLQDKEFKKILNKVGSRWEAMVNELNRWRDLNENNS